MFKTLTLLVTVLLLTSVKGWAQADTNKVYTLLEDAKAHPSEVYKLDLSKNKLEAIPEEIFAMKNLRELYLGKNKITVIPAAIGQLTNLRVLDVSRNKLTAIPLELFTCFHLKKLVLNQNLITAVPKEIAKLQELEYLDLWSNELETLPQDISKCKKLKEVDLRVINIPNVEQQRIANLLPNAKVFMSPSCNCSN